MKQEAYAALLGAPLQGSLAPGAIAATAGLSPAQHRARTTGSLILDIMCDD
jgi:hypothetical protein